MRSRVLYADIFRAGATFAVVVLHTTAPILYEFNSIDRIGWLIADVVYSCCRWAVPAFLMLSGMLLLDTSRSESWKSFFRKRFNKVVVPFIMWSIIYSFWSIEGHNITHYIVSDEGFPYSVSRSVRDFVMGDVHYHLWYFYPLIALYIMTPVIRFCVKGASARKLACALVLWPVAAGCYSGIRHFSGLSISGPAYYATFAVVAIGYFATGHFLNTVVVGRRGKLIIYAAGMSGLLATIIGTYLWTSRSDGVLQTYFYDFLSVNVILLSVAVFLAFSRVDWGRILAKCSHASRFLVTLSGASLGVYLVHPLFLETLHMLGIDAMFVHPAVAIPAISFFTLVASVVVVTLLRRVPLIRRIVP